MGSPTLRNTMGMVVVWSLAATETLDPQGINRSAPRVFQAALECSEPGLAFRRVRGSVHQDADPPHLVALLCMAPHRPRRNAAEQRDKLAPSHSITSSARASSVGDTSKPSALAVPRLMINSHWIARSIGKSA